MLIYLNLIEGLGLGLIDHTMQKVAAMQIADMKVCADQSDRVAVRHQSLIPSKTFSIL